MPAFERPASIPRSVRIGGGILLALFILAWSGLQGGKYRPDDADDAWSLSFCYDYVHRGIVTDWVSGSTRNQAGVQYFGKSYAFLMAKALDLLGWTKTNGHLLPLLFLLGGLAFWVPLLRHFRFSRALTFAFAASTPLFEPFFSTAVCARSESFLFLLATLSALFFVKERYFLSALALGLAAETHPTGGIISAFYIGAAFAVDAELRRKWMEHPWRKGAWFFLGLAISATYFSWLHWDILLRLPAFLLANNKAAKGMVSNLLFAYFFETKFFRHVPELGVFLAAGILYFKRKLFRTEPFLNALLAFSLLFSLVLRHPNFHYALYCYPAFLLICLRVAEDLRGMGWLMAGWGLLLVPQYGAICYLNRSFDFNKEISSIQAVVPSDNLPVLGGVNEWYAFYDRDFYFNNYAVRETPLKIGKFYLVEDPNYRNTDGDCKRWIEENFKGRLLKDMEINGRRFSVYREVPLGRNRFAAGT